MRIDINEIPDAGWFADFGWGEEQQRQFAAPNEPYQLSFEHPLQVHLEVHKRSDHIRVQGAIGGMMQLSCHRCLELFSLPVAQEIDAFLLPRQEKEGEAEKEIELNEEDLDQEFFDGDVIDVDRLVAEQIFLALPFKVLCSENCKGICPGCGANLNLEPCRCAKKKSDSPFAVLSRLQT